MGSRDKIVGSFRGFFKGWDFCVVDSLGNSRG